MGSGRLLDSVPYHREFLDRLSMDPLRILEQDPDAWIRFVEQNPLDNDPGTGFFESVQNQLSIHPGTVYRMNQSRNPPETV